MSFLEVTIMCVHPIYASIMNAIRRCYAERGHATARKLKNQLPRLTPAGTFDGAHIIKDFLPPSHIVGLDYDHVKNRLQIIQRCVADPHTVAAIESPTDGVKVFAYVEGIEDRHHERQQLVSRYYNQLLGLESDPAYKDESRLCYFSYSPNGYVAALYQAFVLEPLIKEETNTFSENGVLPPSPLQGNAPENVFEEEVTQFISSYIFSHPLTAGQRHSSVLRLACEACHRHYPQKNMLRKLSLFFEHTDFRSEELTRVLSSGYKQVNEHAPTSFPTGDPSFQKDIRTKRQCSAAGSSDADDEACWLGEEFRKGTPLFPHGLYSNLPDLLDDCIIEDGSECEQDVAPLSNPTALSAALPQTSRTYNHERYSTYMFSVILSPAASGKNVAQTGRYLLEEMHSEILSTSESMVKNYQTVHNNWQSEYQEQKEKGKTYSEEPRRPPFKMLFIPATTSYTCIQMQMQDSGPQGSIIFDTKAQTLSTTNHLDCGNFDDMLRKAFEHEDINSFYKANGLIPVHIRHPELALLLTGTPGQINGLLSSYENGLPSRALIYTFREAPHWKGMGDDYVSLGDSFKPVAHRVSELCHFCLARPVLFHFNRLQWNRLNGTFPRILSEVALEGNDDLQAIVKRYASLVMRISMIQTCIRQSEAADLSPGIYCTDVDFERSLQIILCCYEHSRLLYSSMLSPSVHPLKDPNTIHNFVQESPDSLTTDEAIQVGAKYDFNHRKVARLLESLNEVKINKVSHGSYTKMGEQ